MTKRYCYTGLNRRILVTGVPLMFLFWEAVFCVAGIFLFGINIIATVLFCAAMHIAVARFYKRDIKWLDHLLFRIRIPERKIYRRDRAWLPKTPKD